MLLLLVSVSWLGAMFSGYRAFLQNFVAAMLVVSIVLVTASAAAAAAAAAAAGC